MKEDIEKLKKAVETAYCEAYDAHEALAFAEEKFYYAEMAYKDALNKKKERYNGRKRK